MEHLVSYRYHSYTDTLIALGTAVLIEHLSDVEPHRVSIRAVPAGFLIAYPDGPMNGERNPFIQIKDKPSRAVSADLGPGQLWDKTAVQKGDTYPDWWGTSSAINTLGSPDFNNRFYELYTPELGQALLRNDAALKLGSMSQLLYAQASKGVNSPRLSTAQGNLKAEAEQMIAHLGYQHAAAGFIKDAYTLTVVPRPSHLGSISLDSYRELVRFLRTFRPSAASGKPLPPGDQTFPFFMAMMYFDFVERLFDYLPRVEPERRYARRRGVGRVIGSLDRMMYYKMGTGSAPFAADSLTIPDWLDEKPVTRNVRDVVRQTLGKHLDPNLLYLPVTAFAEGEPRALVKFYRQYNPLEEKKKLLSQDTLRYIMEKTGYEDLNCPEMQRFARAVRSRTLSKLYSSSSSEPPDYELLTKLKSAALEEKRLINMLSEFVGSYNLRNARQTAIGKRPEGPNLSYDDLQIIIKLIGKYGPEFVANTLMAQAMSKRPDEPQPADAETTPEATNV